MSWDWLGFKKMGVRVSVPFGRALASEKEAFRRKWDMKCLTCGVPRWNHLLLRHKFRGEK